MKLPKFDYACPTTVEEAVALLAAGDGMAKALSGGQSLMPVLAFRLSNPSMLVDLNRIPGLADITIGDDGVRLGARVRWCDIEGDARLKTAHPLLASAMTHVAHYGIRKRGTVGGSLAHADPAAEMPGIAVACDAELTLVSPRGTRLVTAEAFFLGPLTTDLASDELITEIHLPAWPASRRCGFEEFSRRQGDFALAGVAAYYDPGPAGHASNTHIGVIGVSDRPRRLHAAEAVLNGAIVDTASIEATGAAAAKASDPPDDIHGSAAYRRSLLGTMVERALARASA